MLFSSEFNCFRFYISGSLPVELSLSAPSEGTSFCDVLIGYEVDLGCRKQSKRAITDSGGAALSPSIILSSVSAANLI